MNIKGFLEGRGIVIALAVIISTLSFSLGFFVGKLTDKSGNVNDALKETDEAQVKGDIPFASPSNAVSSDAAFLNSLSNAPAPAENKGKVEGEAGDKQGKPAEGKGALKSEHAAVLTNKPDMKNKEAKAKVVAPEPKEEGLWCIQAGAFGNQRDAEVMKKRLEANGHEAYIVRQEREGAVLHKVRAGRFKTKKEADEAAIKLRTAEGIDAFSGKE